jgi:hypothetical protein
MSRKETENKKTELKRLNQELKLAENKLKEHRRETRRFLKDSGEELSILIPIHLGHVDHKIDTAKFLITISATGLFAAFGLKGNLVDTFNLLIISGPVLVGSTYWLISLLKYRDQRVEMLENHYLKRQEGLLTVYDFGSDSDKKSSKP